MKRFISLLSALLVYGFLFSQIGGVSTYDFLSLSPSARITALGGTNITLMDHDPGTQLDNPASLNPLMSRAALFSTSIYPGGINFGDAAYVQKFKIPGTFGFGLQYISYGNFTETDEQANILGTFTASEMNIYAGYGYQFGKIFSVGANIKYIYSHLAWWSSDGMAGDLSAMLNDSAHLITVTIAAKNIGGEIKPYNPGVYEPIPFDLEAGFAFGLKHLPFKFHITFHHLYEWNIRYANPADNVQSTLFDSSQTSKSYVVDNIFRHIIIGTEINIKKVVRLEIAYNHLRQQELRLTTKVGLPGLSLGFGLHIRQFDFSYAFQPLAQGQTLNQFTLSVNTGGFVKRKTVPKDKT